MPAKSAPSCRRLLVAVGSRGGLGGSVLGRQRLRASGEEQGADIWLGLDGVARETSTGSDKCMELVITQEVTEKLLPWRARS